MLGPRPRPATSLFVAAIPLADRAGAVETDVVGTSEWRARERVLFWDFDFRPENRLGPEMRSSDPSDAILTVKRFPGRLLLGPVSLSLIFKKGAKRARKH